MLKPSYSVWGPSSSSLTHCPHSARAFLKFGSASGQKAGGQQQLPLYLSVYTALALAAILLTMSCIWIVFLEVMPQSAVCLHWKLLDVVRKAPLSFFASTDTGVILNRFSQDMSLVDLALSIALITVCWVFLQLYCQSCFDFDFPFSFLLFTFSFYSN
jgi:ABC-type multidrug transport system fused ATPase/permease subunit